MTQTVPHVIIEALCYNEDFTRHVLPFLKEEYFGELSDRKLFVSVRDHFDKFDHCPQPRVVAIAINEQDLPEGVHKQCIETLETFEQRDFNNEWLVEVSEKFCKDRAVYNGIMRSIEIIDGKNKDLNRDAIPTLLEEALGVSFDTAIGHDYFDDAESRFDMYQHVEERIPFGLEVFNKVTRGGVARKSLSVVIADTGGGKSMFMVDHAAHCLRQGHNVLYITLELAEERVAERIDANVLNVPLNAIEKMSKDSFSTKVTELNKKTQGRLVIKEYPTSSVHAGHFKTLLSELKQKKKFKPDIIFVDYLNLCLSQRYKASSGANSYTIIKSIAEELRGIAMKEDVAIMSATQVNRQGASNSDFDMTSVSESYGLPATLDFFFALIPSEEMDSLGQIQVKILKNRWNDPNYYKRFVVGIERAKMKFFDVETDVMTDLVDVGRVDKSEKQQSKFSTLKF